MRDWRERNRERRKLYKQQYFQKNKEAIREYNRIRYMKNREHMRELQNKLSPRYREKRKAYHREHAEQVRRWDVEYRVKNRRVLQEKCREHMRKIKRFLVDKFGGKCELCGYSKYLGAMDFHHKHGKKDLIPRSWVKAEKITTEDFSLLCANCHREIHNGQNEHNEIKEATNCLETQRGERF